MKREQLNISGRTCYLYHDAEATHLLIQPADEHDLEVLDQEVEAIRTQTTTPYSLVAMLIEDWNQELTPWVAPAVFGRIPFGCGANNTLKFITEQLLPSLSDDGIYDTSMRLILGGYSLAGLFSLWSAYQTDIFDGIAATSPSVWFPQWIDYVTEKRPLAKSIYLSLGDKEERAKNRWNSESHQARLDGRVVTKEGKANPVMAQVGNAIRKQHDLLMEQEVNTILEWNVGNHFVDSEKRMAKGFAWLLNNMK